MDKKYIKIYSHVNQKFYKDYEFGENLINDHAQYIKCIKHNRPSILL